MTRKGKERSWKRRLVLGGSAFLLLVTILSVIVLRVRFNGDALAATIERSLNERIRGKVAIGSVEWALEDLPKALAGGWVEVTITDVRVEDQEDGEVVLEVPRLTAELDAQRFLFRGQHLVLRNIRIVDGGRALIKQVPEPYPLHEYDRNVVSLIAAFYPKQRDGFRAGIGAHTSPLYDLRDFTIDKVALDFDFPGLFTASVEGVSGTGFFYADVSDPLRQKLYYSLKPVAQRGTLELFGLRFDLTDIDVTKLCQLPDHWPRDAVADSLFFRATATTTEGARLAVNGGMLGYYTDIFGGDYDITVTVDGAGPLAARLSNGVASGPALRGVGHITGPTVNPKVQLRLADLAVAVPVQPPLDLRLASFVAAFDLATNSGSIEDTEALGGGGRIQLQANFSLDPYSFDVNIHIPEAIEIAPYLPEHVIALAGSKLSGELHAAGNMQTQKLDRLKLQLGKASLRGELFRDDQGMVAIEKPLAVTIGKTHLHATGQVDLARRSLSLGLRFVSNDLPRYLRHFRAPELAQGMTGSARVRGAFTSPRVDADGTTTGVPFLDRVVSKLAFDKDVLTLREAHSQSLGGHVRAAGSVDLGKRTSVVDLRAEAKGVDLSRLPLVGAFLGGTLDATASARGPTHRIVATGDAEARDLEIAGDAYKTARITGRADLDGSRQVEVLLERRDGGLLDVRATLDRGGALGGVLSLRDVQLDSFGTLTGEEAPFGGRIDTELLLGGTLEAPTVEGDATLVGAWLGRAFLGPAELHFEPAGDGLVRVTGELFQGRVKVDARVSTREPFEVDATIGLLRVEVDQFLPELAARWGARAWASGSVAIQTTLLEVPGRTPKIEMYLTEATLLIDNEDSSGRPAPLRLRNRTPVHLGYADGRVRLVQSAIFRGPGGDFTLSGAGSGEELDLKLAGRVAVRMLEPYLREYFEELAGHLTVEATIAGPLAKPEITALVDIEELAVRPARQDAVVTIPSGRIQLERDQLSLTGITLDMHDPFADERASLDVSGGIQLDDFEPVRWAVQINGELAGKMLLVVTPQIFSQASGVAELSVALHGAGRGPDIDGSIAFDGQQPLTLTPRGLRREIALTGGELKFTDSLVEVIGVRGLVDDEGSITNVSGEVSLRHWKPVDMDLTVSADALPFRVPKTLDVTVAVNDLRVLGGEHQLSIEGTVEIIDGRYIQNFNVAKTIWQPERATETSKPFYEEVPLLANADLELNVVTRSFFVQNNIAPTIELAGGVRVLGTPTNPRFDGEITVEQGTFKLPGMRTSFTRTSGTVSFSRYKSFPQATPELDIHSEAEYRDSSGQDHIILLDLSGPIYNPRWDLKTSTGLNKGQTVALLFSGKTPDELRATLGDDAAVRDPTKTGRTGVEQNVYDQMVKDIAGDFISLLLEDRLRNLTSLDVARITIGTGSFGLRGEKSFFKNLRALGEYERTVRGSTIDAAGQLRVDHNKAVELKYLNQQFSDETEEDREDLRFQFIWRFPLMP